MCKAIRNVTVRFFLSALALGPDASGSTIAPYLGADFSVYRNQWVFGIPRDTVDGALDAWWNWNIQYTGISPYGSLQCGYTTVPINYLNRVLKINMTGDCSGGTYLEGTWRCPDGFKSSSGLCVPDGKPITKKNLGKSCPATGNPINPTIGNKFHVETDYQGSGVFPLRFSRTYNSAAKTAGHRGSKWSHTFSANITETSRNGLTTAVATDSSGRAYYFTDGGAGFTADEDVREKLSRTESGWTKITSDDSVETYDAAGFLKSVKDVAGNTHTLIYDPQRRVSRVESNTGDFLAFTYTNWEDALIETMTDRAGRVWTYAYDDHQNLEYVYFPDESPDTVADNPYRRYHYNEPEFTQGADFVGALTGISDRVDGVETRYANYEYDASGRAIASYHADGVDRVDIAYNADGTREITNSRGATSIYSTVTQLGVSLVSSISGPGCSTCGGGNTAFEYDPITNNLLSKTENGLTTAYGNFDSNGNPGYIIEAFGTSDERRTDYTYESRYQSRVLTVKSPSVYNGQSRTTTYTYDDFGNRTSVTVAGFTPDGTPMNRSTTWQFNGPLHQLSRIDGPRTDVADVTLFRYYADDPAQGVNRARLKEVEDAAGHIVRGNIHYSSTGKVVSETRPNGVTLTYAYKSGLDRLLSVTESDGVKSRETRWTYLETGEVKTITLAADTPEATTITFEYDDARRLTRVTDASGDHIEYVLDTEGNLIEENVRDNSGALKKALIQTFDSYNRLDTSSSANEFIDYDYAPDGTLSRVTDGRGHITVFSYDELRRKLTSTADLEGIAAYKQLGYDTNDRLVRVIDPLDASTNLVYDDLGNLLAKDSPDTGLTTYTHDNAGNMVSRQDAMGRVYLYGYDVLDRLLYLDAPGTSDDVNYLYDNCTNGVHRQCGVTNQAQKTTYLYDAFGNITWHQGLNYTYDNADRLKTILYPSGSVLSHHYDPVGRLNQLDLTRGTDTISLASDIEYTPFGGIVSMTYGNGSTLSQVYDTAYRITSQSTPGILEHSYSSYDANGNLEVLTRAPSITNSYSYDALNRLDTVSGAYGGRDYDYDNNGNRIRLTSDTTTVNYSYAADSNRLSRDSNWVYQLDANGNTSSRLDAEGAGLLFGHNANNRLSAITRRTLPGGSIFPVDTLLATYQYNGLGQRIHKTAMVDQETHFIFGTDGALLAEMDETGATKAEYFYQNGQLIGLAVTARTTVPGTEVVVDDDDPGASSTGFWSAKSSGLSYNGSYQLAGRNKTHSTYRWTPSLAAGSYDLYTRWEERKNQSTSAPYTIVHNRNTDRVYVDQQTGGGVWQLLGSFTFDGSGGEYVELSNENGKVTADAIRLVERVPATTPFETLYVHNDHLGTPLAMSDSAGTISWRANYEPFGEARIDENPDGDNLHLSLNVRMPGQYYDQESGLHYNYYRDYDPGLGRYIQSDPIGLAGGLNTYAYVAGNPINWIDPDGLETRRCARRLGGKLKPAMSPSGNPMRHDYLVVDGDVYSFQAGENFYWSDGFIDNDENTNNQKCKYVSNDPMFDKAVRKAVSEIGAPKYNLWAYPSTPPYILGARNCQTWVDDVLNKANELYKVH